MTNGTKRDRSQGERMRSKRRKRNDSHGLSDPSRQRKPAFPTQPPRAPLRVPLCGPTAPPQCTHVRPARYGASRSLRSLRPRPTASSCGHVAPQV